MRALLALSVALVVLLSAAPAGASKACGVGSNFLAKDYTYSVKIKSGDISCAKASKVLAKFVKKATQTDGFNCARTHGGNDGIKPVAKCGDDDGAFFTATLVAG